MTERTRVTDQQVEAAAAALSLAVTKTSVATGKGQYGPPGCPLTAGELRYLARTALEASEQ